MSRSRWSLHLEAHTWRSLMGVGMWLHRIPYGPHHPTYSFTKTIPSTLFKLSGNFNLLFYTPPDYQKHPVGSDHKNYPVVVNFHGGGFTIGAAHDDSRWADAVVHNVDAVVVSVEYRLAPEYPFPTAVEDGVDAILYLIDHAEELSIDPDRIAVSGFSAGGNMAFTVPLRLQEELRQRKEEDHPGYVSPPSQCNIGKLRAIMAWYPSTDYATWTRSERKMTNVRKGKSLPSFFTDLFDAAYLYPPKDFPLASPFLSPGLAPEEMLKALPDDILMFTCEWDELRAEAEKFRDRLRGIEGKRVTYRMIEGVAHAFDKNPNPLWHDHKIEALYEEACAVLVRALNDEQKS